VQNALGTSPLRASLFFPAFNVGVVAGSLAGPHLLRRLGVRQTAAAGLVAIAAGIALLAGLAAGPGIVALLPVAFGTAGVGLGAASMAWTTAGTEAVDPVHHGLAVGILTSAAQVGTAVGLALLTPVLGTQTNFPSGFLGACAVSALGLLASRLLRRSVTEPSAATPAAGWASGTRR
jgi:MFS family permease